MYSLEEALANWKEAAKPEKIEDRIARAQKWLPYYDYLAKSGEDLGHRCGQCSEVAGFLERESLLNKGDYVLDLGAGTGGYSLEFARLAKSVTAVDLSSESLKILKSRMNNASFTNINLKCSAWEEFEPEGKFDLVFSAMCPAICDEEQLLRFEAMSRKSCCLLTVMRGSYERCRSDLMKELVRERGGGMVTEAIHYLNVLYLMGRKPSLKSWTCEYTTEEDVGELLERYKIYFGIFGVDECVSVPHMKKYFAEHAKDGKITDEHKINYALIYWNK